MLVLNRKKGQSICIGEQIRITVVDVQGDYIKIGIDAPREVGVYRQEIYREIVAANMQAAAAKPGQEPHHLLDDLFKAQLETTPR
ncbi:MAG TPA: carbon storage regulator [Syntrophomonas sp.]|jgi:carbon storage regulator|nr:carbon storage regulator [Syntrophomonas sp.]